MRAIAALALLLALVGCGAPRTAAIPRDAAMADDRECALRVLKAWDAVRLAGPSESSHVIEVEVLDGPEDRRGRRLTLPYDEWNVGAPPPEAGTIVRTSPRGWVARDRTSQGKPFTGWQGTRPLER